MIQGTLLVQGPLDHCTSHAQFPEHQNAEAGHIGAGTACWSANITTYRGGFIPKAMADAEKRNQSQKNKKCQ